MRDVRAISLGWGLTRFSAPMRHGHSIRTLLGEAIFIGRARGMRFGKKRRYVSGDYDHERLPRTARPQRLLAGTGLAGVALVCAFTICANLGGPAVHQALWELSLIHI